MNTTAAQDYVVLPLLINSYTIIMPSTNIILLTFQLLLTVLNSGLFPLLYGKMCPNYSKFTAFSCPFSDLMRLYEKSSICNRIVKYLHLSPNTGYPTKMWLFLQLILLLLAHDNFNYFERYTCLLATIYVKNWKNDICFNNWNGSEVLDVSW